VVTIDLKVVTNDAKRRNKISGLRPQTNSFANEEP
jgi:hypothetical protein